MDSQPAPKKFYKQWWFWVIVVLVIALGSSNKSNDQTRAVAPTPETQAQTANVPVQAAPTPVKKVTVQAPVQTPAPTPAPAPVASTPHVPVVLLQTSGSGTKSTQTFIAPSSWTLDYSYDCSSFGSQGNFQVYIFNGSGGMTTLGGPNQLGMSGSDTEYYHQGGTYYLEINSECSWTVTAKG